MFTGNAQQRQAVQCRWLMRNFVWICIVNRYPKTSQVGGNAQVCREGASIELTRKGWWLCWLGLEHRTL